MTVAFESGYALPGGDLALNFARILHEGNRFKIKSTFPSAEATDYPGSAVNAGDTVDRWKPFANGVTEPTDLSDWTLDGVTIGADGKTVSEDTSSGTHDLETPYTFGGGENVFSVRINRYTFITNVRLFMNDGTNTRTVWFDLTDLSVGTTFNGTGQVIELGNDLVELKMYSTQSAGTGYIKIEFGSGGEVSSYVGDTDNTLVVSRVAVNKSESNLRIDGFASQAGDVYCLAGHNLGSSGTRITFEHDNNNDDTWTSLGTLSPTDDSPIMFIHEGVTSSRWRISLDRGVLPEIAVLRVGALLQMERPFYGGHAVSRMNRNTSISGNISGSGQLLGRAKKRTVLNGAYAWNNLTYTWVRANLDGPTGLIQAAEIEPLFVAWRASETQDVDYVMRATVKAPTAQGVRDLHNFSMEGEVHAYE